MTKHQEKKFKDFVKGIEYLIKDYCQVQNEIEAGMDMTKEQKEIYQDLRECKKSFLEWFKKSLK
jgi:hypothetical protein